MNKLLILIFISNCIFLIGCKQKYLNYPYAENNTTIQHHYNHTITDDYKWLETDPRLSKNSQKWLNEEQVLSNNYFKKKGHSIYNRINELASFERFVLIKSQNDTLYYAGIYPYSNHINIYRYDSDKKKNIFIKHFDLPFQVNYNVNALVLKDGEHIAIIGSHKDEIYDLYIYDLKNKTDEAIKTINHIINRPLNNTDKGFIFTKDALAAGRVYSGSNSLFHCTYHDEGDNKQFKTTELFSDTMIFNPYVFDTACDIKTGTIYIGRYSTENDLLFEIFAINTKHNTDNNKVTIDSPKGELLRLAGADDINFYIIAIDGDFKGSLYAINKKTKQKHVVIRNTFMKVQDFATIKNHAIIYYKKDNLNRGYLINKHTLAIDEIPLKDYHNYRFLRNKNLENIYFQVESLLSPKEIYSVSPDSLKPERITERSKYPYNPDDYKIEYVSHLSETGDTINLKLTYKKGTKRDRSNPVILCTFLNSDNSYLDVFYLSRILYMEHGFIFVQRSSTDSKRTINLDQRVKDTYASIQYLSESNFTTPEKIALIGREYGATSLMQLLNSYKGIKTPVVLTDGIYDLVNYNENGKLNYYDNKLLYANDEKSFDELINSSPYHNVKNKRSYPPILLMVSHENKDIPKHDTYKMTAKLQMRSRGYNPIIMLTPEQNEMNEQINNYCYKRYIEHAFIFLMQNMNIDTFNYENKCS